MIWARVRTRSPRRPETPVLDLLAVCILFYLLLGLPKLFADSKQVSLALLLKPSKLGITESMNKCYLASIWQEIRKHNLDPFKLS